MPKSAREKLAAAHKNMSPEDIADHALALAACVESSDEVNRVLVETLSHLITGYENAVNQIGAGQMIVRRIASLNAARRFKDARTLAADSAAIELVKLKMPPAPVHIPAESAWPEIYSPTPR
jgi:hypothetical protein